MINPGCQTGFRFDWKYIMRNNRLLSAVLAVLLPLSVQAGSLSRSLTDQEFTVAVPGQDSSSKDKSRIFKDALNRLTEKLSGGVYDSVNLNGRSIDYFVDNFGFRNSDLVVNFDRIKVMQLLRSQNIPLYLDARPDIMVWMSIYDEKYNVSDIMSESSANSFTSSLMQTGSGYGMKFFLPIMDSDDASFVNDKVIHDFDANALSSANARYATRYYITGTVQGYNTENGDLVWKLFEAGSGTPLFQSVAHGLPYDLGNIVAKDVVKYFAKQHPEYISDDDVPAVAESSGFNSAPATGEEPSISDSSSQTATPAVSTASNRIELFGGVVSANKVRIVVVNVVKFQDVVMVEKSLKNIDGISKVMLSQSQSDQLVYELTLGKDYKEVSSKIGEIPGLYIADQSKPYNFYFDSQRKNNPAVQTLNTSETQTVSSETVGKEKNSGTAASAKTESGKNTAARNENTGTGETEEKTANSAAQSESKKADSGTQETGGYEEIEAIPILDPNSVKDTSNRKL